MSTPTGERPEPTYAHAPYNLSNIITSEDRRRSVENSLPTYNVNNQARKLSNDRSSEEGTMVGEVESHPNGLSEKTETNGSAPARRNRGNTALTVPTNFDTNDRLHPMYSMQSPSATREQASRLDDDLEMLKIERQVSRMNDDDQESTTKSKDMSRQKSRRREEHIDEFDAATNPVHEQTQVYKPVEHPSNGFGKLLKRIHHSNWLVRWIFYISPLTLIILIPLLLGVFLFDNKGEKHGASVGGVYLSWFCIWLEIVWLSLWLGRIIAKCLPWPIGLIASLFTNNNKKWRDMGKQLELPATIFFWWLAIEISFLPTMTSHRRPGYTEGKPDWTDTMNKVLVSFFVGAILNFIEKVIIQLIAISFHLRTYADRIEINKFQIGSLTKLYIHSKEKIAMDDAEFEAPSRDQPGSGARTPGQLVTEAAQTTKIAMNKFGDVAGRVAADFTGKQTQKSTHPHQVILSLLHTSTGAQVLARRLYRTFARDESETVFSDDLRPAFENGDEADAAFSMFDKDMNGDISMEELEAVCVEIGRERKSITASLKDLDSVVAKLDDVFMFVVFVIVILVFISLISTSAAGFLTSAGSVVLALSWLLAATSQEFLQSCIFVFVKHPFDVGDRVQVYGNTGAMGLGDDYFVKEISLLYTEFKKMEGHIVQAPNSYLNTLFILNQRRSGGLAEAVPIDIKFGTTLEQLDGLRAKLLEFVLAEKREFQGKILTELRNVNEVHSITLNVVFFYKTNWQNEGLRLARRNKFFCALMVAMQELGIEGPRMRYPGQKQSFPVYLQNVPHIRVPGMGHGGHPDQPGGIEYDEPEQQDPPFVAPVPGQEESTGSQQPEHSRMRSASIMSGSARNGTRPRGESLSAMNRRVDFSLGAKSSAVNDNSGDVFESRSLSRIPAAVAEASRERERESETEALRRSLEQSLRQSHDTARATSRDDRVGPGNLYRRSTEGWRGSVHSVHRNRFFRRAYGNGDEEGLMESGQMADIPEVPSRAGTGGTGHLDSRTGLVSPQAWRTRTSEDNMHPPQIQPIATLNHITNMSIAPGVQRPMGRSQTVDFEMQRLR